MNLFTVLAVFAFVFGAVVASFLNVVIWRVPRGESIVSPPSHCPKCGARIRWYANIPILSWLCLRGRCAACRAPISPRYVYIEMLGGILFLETFCHFGISLATLVIWVWISLMIVGAFIDFDFKLLPDFVTVGGMILGVVTGVGSSAMLFLRAEHIWWFSAVNSLVGLAFGFGLLLLIRCLGTKAFHREAMGMGDVFLMGAVGAIFGPVAVLVTLVLSSVFGSLVGLVMIAASKARIGSFAEIPYGPYICLGCLVYIFFGEALIAWYACLFR